MAKRAEGRHKANLGLVGKAADLSAANARLKREMQERKRAEEALEQSEARFRNAFDFAAIGMAIVSLEGKWLQVNRAICEIVGYSAVELQLLSFQDITHPDDLEADLGYVKQLLRGEIRTYQMEKRYFHKNGHVVWVLLSVTLVRRMDGTPLHFISQIQDITQRKQAEKALGESEARFRDLTALSSDWYWEQDENYRFTSISGISQYHLEHRRDVSLGKARWEIATLHPLDGHWDGHKALLERRESFHNVVLTYLSKTNETGYMSVSGKAVFDEAGNFKGYRGTGRDITEQKQAEQAIRSRATQQSLIAVFGQQALASSDLDELIARAVKVVGDGMAVAFCSVLQLDQDRHSLILKAGSGWKEDWLGKYISGRDAANDAETQNQYVRVFQGPVMVDEPLSGAGLAKSDILRLHDIQSGVEVAIHGSDRQYGVLGAYSREMRRFTPEDVNFLQSVANTLGTAIERKNVEDKVSYLAQFDSLTGLPNRNLFRDRLTHTLTLAQRNAWQVGVIFLDLDDFKAVNDTYGHGAGDKLLALVARRLLDCVRKGDTVARLAGDEFAFVLSHLAKAEDASLVVQKIVAALVNPFDLDGHEVYLTASVGIALYPADGLDAEVLLNNADAAMYRAKALGRNSHQFYLPEMNEREVERRGMEAQLRGALERGEFLLHYQPKVDLISGSISGFEALLRWQHPQRGLVQPLQFISILEETGLIVPVGEWVVRSVCDQLCSWQEAGVMPCPIAINLSARQFKQKNLDAVIGAILKDAGVDPRFLEFELTESLLMSDAHESVNTLRNLKAYGVRLSVDDFGTGYSSLAYLKRFPLDALKIDRTFIADVTTDPDDATITLAIISLAHSLQLRVVAEGVETEGQLKFLKAHGCDEMQGYYFAQPLNVGECTQALIEHRRLHDPVRP
jgi:diguanylate cyclase (GGDEF)-like protein/PAS domain S-box-containing protein